MWYARSMRDNKLIVEINQPVDKVYEFTITPPNSAKWIPGVVKEETNEWPIRIGTVYKLTDKDNKAFQVIVSGLKKNKMIEWTKDKNYHCRYTYKPLSKTVTELEYYEWVDKGDIDELLTKATLEKLKEVLEKEK